MDEENFFAKKLGRRCNNWGKRGVDTLNFLIKHPEWRLYVNNAPACGSRCQDFGAAVPGSG